MLVVGQPTVGNNMEQYAMVYQVSTITVSVIDFITTIIEQLKRDISELVINI